MSQSKGSPRKFAEKIALLNKKEAEANAEFEKIIKEVEETTRAPCSSRTSSFSGWNGDRPDINSQQLSLDNSFNYYSNEHISIVTQQPHDASQIYQQQQLHVPHQSSPDPMRIQTPDGMPSIEIFPIQYDDNYEQQQVTTNNYCQLRNDCSNSINAARSLPDIANLRVSGSYTEMPINQNYYQQQQQIPVRSSSYNNIENITFCEGTNYNIV